MNHHLHERSVFEASCGHSFWSDRIASNGHIGAHIQIQIEIEVFNIVVFTNIFKTHMSCHDDPPQPPKTDAKISLQFSHHIHVVVKVDDEDYCRSFLSSIGLVFVEISVFPCIPLSSKQLNLQSLQTM